MRSEEIAFYLQSREYDEVLNCLESILSVTKYVCQGHEFLSEYYNLQDKGRLFLSEERNQYITMLSLALDKISRLRKINDKTEGMIFSYNKIPTIAAER